MNLDVASHDRMYSDLRHRDRVNWSATGIIPRILIDVPVAEPDQGFIRMEDILLPIILASPLMVVSDTDCWIVVSINRILVSRVQLKACTGRENLQ